MVALQTIVEDILCELQSDNTHITADVLVSRIKSGRFGHFSRMKDVVLRRAVQTWMPPHSQDNVNDAILKTYAKCRKVAAVSEPGAVAKTLDGNVDSKPLEALDKIKNVPVKETRLPVVSEAPASPVSESPTSAGSKESSEKRQQTLRHGRTEGPKRRRNLLGQAVEKSSLANSLSQQCDPSNPEIPRFNPSPLPTFDLSAMGGCERVVASLRKLVVAPLRHAEIFRRIGDCPVTGVLLHGPPGSGKTKAALATAGEAKVPFFHVVGPELIGGVTGESEQMIRALFDAAVAAAPSLIFIDEIDTLCPKRDLSGREMERRIVAQLATCLNGLANSFVIVIAATNRVNSLDAMLRCNGRFDDEVPIGMPDTAAREAILKALVAERNVRLSPTVNFRAVAQATPGFVGADLLAVVKKAQLRCLERTVSLYGEDLSVTLPFNASVSGASAISSEAIGVNNTTPDHSSTVNVPGPCGPIVSTDVASAEGETLNKENANNNFSSAASQSLQVTDSDLLSAVGQVQPSSKREGFATVPDVSWDDVGGLIEQREELDEQICFPIRGYELYKELGLRTPAGVLMYGPPGCGKTLLAKAVAAESGANFISVKGPELMNKYVGESERAIRQVFERARISAPCVIFFDELDSLCGRRGAEGSSGVSERVVNQMLTEMDGVQGRENVYVIAATNRPDQIDPAMLRPGRLDRWIYVPLPDEMKRRQILAALGRKMKFAGDVDLNYVASITERFSGADLAALLDQSLRMLLRELRERNMIDWESSKDFVVNECVAIRHIQQARETVKPSVTPEQAEEYTKIARFKND